MADKKDRKSTVEEKAVEEASGFLQGFWDTVKKLIELAAEEGDLEKKMEELDERIEKEDAKIKKLNEEIRDLEEEIDEMEAKPAPPAGAEKKKFDRKLKELKEELEEKEQDKADAKETKANLQKNKKKTALGGKK